MRHRLPRSLFAAVVVLLAGTRDSAQTPRPQSNAVVIFETEKGTIELEVDSVHAPATAANFLKYVDAGFYDGGSVNRAVRPDNTVRRDVEIQVIQFQIDAARRQEQFAPIPLERTSVTELKHVDGTISMARTGPDTATASFSIVIGQQPEMDFGGRRNPDGQDLRCSAALSVEWMWSERFRHRRPVRKDRMARSRWRRRSGFSQRIGARPDSGGSVRASGGPGFAPSSTCG
jgi:peptidyl-prolyl cis-trans isomerase A (cyclophilin A)